MKSGTFKSTFNIAVTSVAMALILIPEPTTTFVGLGMLSMLKKNETRKKERTIQYHGDVTYADLVHNRFAFQDASSKKGFLRPAQFAIEPALDNTRLWKQSILLRSSRPQKNVSYETLRGELPIIKRSIPLMFYNPESKSGIKPKKTTSSPNVSERDTLPSARANIPNYYYDPRSWEAAKKRTTTSVSGSTLQYKQGTQPGQLPQPWPNLPRSRYNAGITSARHSR